MSEISDSSAETSEAIAAGLRLAGLHESDHSTVEFFLFRNDDDWRTCCGSNCVPCILQIGQAVDVARARIARSEAERAGVREDADAGHADPEGRTGA